MMPIWLGNFLAQKIVAPLALAACLILGVIGGVQTVRINGVHVFGLALVDGFKPMYEAAISNNITLKANQTTLTAGLATCNSSVASAKASGEQMGAAAQLAADAKKADVALAQAEAKRLLAIKPGANALVTAYHVGLTGVAQ